MKEFINELHSVYTKGIGFDIVIVRQRTGPHYVKSKVETMFWDHWLISAVVLTSAFKRTIVSITMNEVDVMKNSSPLWKRNWVGESTDHWGILTIFQESNQNLLTKPYRRRLERDFCTKSQNFTGKY